LPGKRVQFNDGGVGSDPRCGAPEGRTFQQLADEAFKDLLKKYGQPVGLMAALEQSVDKPAKRRRKKK